MNSQEPHQHFCCIVISTHSPSCTSTCAFPPAGTLTNNLEGYHCSFEDEEVPSCGHTKAFVDEPPRKPDKRTRDWKIGDHFAEAVVDAEDHTAPKGKGNEQAPGTALHEGPSNLHKERCTNGTANANQLNVSWLQLAVRMVVGRWRSRRIAIIERGRIWRLLCLEGGLAIGIGVTRKVNSGGGHCDQLLQRCSGLEGGVAGPWRGRRVWVLSRR